MRNDWRIEGAFVYDGAVYPRLLSLVRAKVLDLSAVRSRVFAFDDIERAMDAAATMRGLDCTILEIDALAG